MDFELISFRIDPEIHERASKACEGLGVELNDVLRSLVTRIARDGSIPFDLGASPPQLASDQTPFHEYDARLWRSVRPPIEAEVAIAVLARFIADCSTRIDEESDRQEPDRDAIVEWAAQREEARQQRPELDVTDAEAVAAIFARYGSAPQDKAS